MPKAACVPRTALFLHTQKRMNTFSHNDERDRLYAEIEALQRWVDDLMHYLEEGVKDKEVTQDDFSNAATMSARVFMRLKALYTRAQAIETRSRAQEMRRNAIAEADRTVKERERNASGSMGNGVPGR